MKILKCDLESENEELLLDVPLESILPSGTVQRVVDIKERIERQTGISTAQQVLVWENRILENEITVDELGIDNSCYLKMYKHDPLQDHPFRMPHEGMEENRC